MSCYYKALPRLIPQVLLLTKPGQEVILVSPWLNNMVLLPPMFGSDQQWFISKEIELRDLLIYLTMWYNIHVSFVIREQDWRADRVLKNWPLPKQLTVKIVRDEQILHAKAIITDDYVLHGSANLIPTSIHLSLIHI